MGEHKGKIELKIHHDSQTKDSEEGIKCLTRVHTQM